MGGKGLREGGMIRIPQERPHKTTVFEAVRCQEGEASDLPAASFPSPLWLAKIRHGALMSQYFQIGEAAASAGLGNGCRSVCQWALHVLFLVRGGRVCGQGFLAVGGEAAFTLTTQAGTRGEQGQRI